MDSEKTQKSLGLKRYFTTQNFNIAVIISIISLLVGGLFYLGKLDERVKSTHERMDRLVEQMNVITARLDKQIDAIDAAKNEAISEIRALTSPQSNPHIFSNGKLTSGYDMGVNSSGGRTNWAILQDGYICMAYPPSQSWGAVFITVGKPTDYSRPAKNISRYQMLSVELRGAHGGESVLIGLKDSTDPDDGSETKVPISDLATEWKTYQIPLSRFSTADLKRIYTITEFVFENQPQTVCFRTIKLLP